MRPLDSDGPIHFFKEKINSDKKIFSKKIFTKKLSPEIINSICKFKDTFWKFGIKSQLEYFHKFINPDDKHFLIYNFDTIIGYGLIRQVDNYFIIDNILVQENYRNKGFGKQIIETLIKDIKEPIYLLCEHQNIKFYEKLDFKINIKVELLDKDIKKLTLMSYNSNSNKLKIKYYNNQ